MFQFISFVVPIILSAFAAILGIISIGGILVAWETVRWARTSPAPIAKKLARDDIRFAAYLLLYASIFAVCTVLSWSSILK